MNLLVTFDPINMADPQPLSLTVMVEPGTTGVTPEAAKAAIEDLLGQMGLAGVPFQMIGTIERHINDAAGKHVHVGIQTHAHS